MTTIKTLKIKALSNKIDLQTLSVGPVQLYFALFSTRREIAKFDILTIRVRHITDHEYFISLEFSTITGRHILVNLDLQLTGFSEVSEQIIKLPVHHSHYFLAGIRY